MASSGMMGLSTPAPVTSPERPQLLRQAALDLPGIPLALLPALAAAAAPDRLALVGGAVRDLLLHRIHADPWRGLPDLDLVVEARNLPGQAQGGGRSPALRLADRLVERCSRSGGDLIVRAVREHGAYGTVELELELDGQLLLLDVATARSETYGQAGENPSVCFGSLADDLARRDFSINAIALGIGAAGGPGGGGPGDGGSILLDPHAGLADLGGRRLRLLHSQSLRDDPTRIVRAARYRARLGFELDPGSLLQWQQTLACWPWSWHPGDPAASAPPALGTRLRMELDLLLERERAGLALAALQSWGALALVDRGLQADQQWRRRLHWAGRLGLPPLAALLAGADQPVAVAERLQIPHRQQRLLAQFLVVRQRLAEAAEAAAGPSWPASRWCHLLEAAGGSPEAVALALAAGCRPRRPLLRWLLRWRHLRAEQGARQLIAAGLAAGPLLGQRLRQLRAERIDREATSRGSLPQMPSNTPPNEAD